MAEHKRPRGRPRKSTKATSRIEVNVTEDEKVMLREKAKGAGHATLASWIKHLMQAA